MKSYLKPNRKNPNKALVCLLAASLFTACTSSKTKKSTDFEFLTVVKKHPDLIWSRTIQDKTKSAIREYQGHQKVGRQLVYGDSVRNFDLRNKTALQVDQEMKRLHCNRKNDVLKNPQTHTPLKDSSGKTIPMISYLCPDGGTVRVKPLGDPTSKFRPQPHATKSLRYPYNSKFENFDDEIVKVDNFGNVIPKWGKDLNQISTSETEQYQFVESWANDAHTDLAQ